MFAGNSFSNVQKYFFLGLLAVVSVLFAWMLKSYLLPVLWAVVFAILLHPVFGFLRKKLVSGGLSAVLTIILAIIVVAVPLGIVGVLLAEDAVSIYQSASVKAPAYIGAISGNSYVQTTLNFFDIDIFKIETYVVNFARTASAWIASQILSVGARTFGAVIKTFITLYLLFFFLKDGEKIVGSLGRTFSLGGGRERQLFEKFALTVRAVFNDTIIVAIIQGFMGGILFFALGISNAVLWGSLMAFLSVIPAVGPSFVWIPASAVFFAIGSPLTAVILLAGGSFISFTDHLLKPVFMGRSTKMPNAIILVSIFGGIATFGIAGVILGPVIAALFLSVWELFAVEYKGQLNE